MLNRNSRGWVAGASAIALGAMLALPTAAAAGEMLESVTNSPALTAQNNEGKTEVTLKVLDNYTSCTDLHVFTGNILPTDINGALAAGNLDSLTKDHTLLYPTDPKAAPVTVWSAKAYDEIDTPPTHFKKATFTEKLPQVEGPHTAYAVCTNKGTDESTLFVRNFGGTGAIGSAELLLNLVGLEGLGSLGSAVTGSVGIF